MIRTMGEIDVKLCLRNVLTRIQNACKTRPDELQYFEPRLVAVSKTKPVDLIIQAFEAGQEHFGENYVQELEEKATNKELLDKCKEIKWHLIGHLQSNKVNKVLALPNIHMIESVDSQKLATQLDKNWPKFGGGPDNKLRVMIQINTSREEEKHGISPDEVTQVTEYVIKECPNLHFQGLMTIGMYGYDVSNGPNPDFLRLLKCRESVCRDLDLDTKTVEISMGMSDDFEQAAQLGSTNVRVGSAIFGQRSKQN